jgi:uncharacterized protein YaaR (DUF327 family)
MEKIDGASPFFNATSYLGSQAELKKAQKPVKSKSLFFNFLEKTEETELSALEDLPVSEETIQKLLDDIHSAGDDLKNHPLPAEILKYKGAVKNFLRFIVKNSYDVEKQYIGIGLHKRKEKTLVQVVDKKLDQLAANILAGQASQLEILARLEEITGILIDLLQ